MNEETAKRGGPLKRIDLDSPSFEANGKKYFIESGLSIERYCEFQLLEKELVYGVSFETLIKKHKDLWKMLNKQEFVAAAVLIDSVVRGMIKIQEREPVVLKICALFINEENEDRSAWNNDLVVKKIADWKAEGIDTKDFFGLALNSVNGFLEVYNRISQAITNPETKDESVLNVL